MIKDFNQLVSKLGLRAGRRRVAVVWAADSATRAAVARALSANFADAIFVGCRKEVESDESLASFGENITIIDAADSDTAAALAVELVRQGEADILMKGMLNTDNLLRAVLNKETGILLPGAVLTHMTAAQLPSYSKLLLFTDAAVIPYPNPEQRRAQVEEAAKLAHSLGTETPKIALIHCSEKVDTKHFPMTGVYQELSELSAEGKLGQCIVDGPMDVKTACSRKAMEKKGLVSPIEGQADVLVFPDIESANVFYKTITLFGEAQTAGILVGAKAPVVLPSRGDSLESKFYSIALAASNVPGKKQTNP